MTTEQLTKRLSPLVDEWPLGIRVWHRADGRCGVLMGYFILIDGEVGFRVDYGGAGWSSEKPTSLQATKPADEDGDEWKEGAGV